MTDRKSFMNCLTLTVCLALCVLMFSTVALADKDIQLNKYGVADTHQLNFTDPVLVGSTLLPKGDYEVTHTMKGEQHVMVFRQLKAEKPLEVSAECVLVKLPKAATQTTKSYILNDKNERVLKEMTFKGEIAKHVF